jgi:hypothetical protein
MEPPNLHLAPWRFGPTCRVCEYLKIKDGKYWCVKYDLNVPNGALCDGFVWDGIIRVA